MWTVILADGALALVLGLWLWTLVRSRAGAIPCAPKAAWSEVVIVGATAVVGAVNFLALRAMGHLRLDSKGVELVVWIGAMSAVILLFSIAVATLQVNRSALVWIRVVEPDALIVREPGAETRIQLAPGSVLALIVGNGLSGPSHVQYRVEQGDRRLNLVVPFTLAAAEATARSPWLERYTGPIAQGGARRLHRFFAPFCRKHPGAEGASA